MNPLFIVELVIFSVTLFTFSGYCIYRNEAFISTMVQILIVAFMSVLAILTVDETVRNPIYALTIAATAIVVNLIILILVVVLKIRAFYWARDIANGKTNKYYRKYDKKRFDKFVATIRNIEYGPRLKYGAPTRANKTVITEIIINGVKKKVKTEFDKRGFPIFSKVFFETKLKRRDFKASREVHFERASKALYKKAKEDKLFARKFTKEELKIFQKGKVPPKYTWHHHQKSGLLQLVLFDVHDSVWHIGGYSIWGKRKNN